jgi:hypothetical protein
MAIGGAMIHLSRPPRSRPPRTDARVARTVALLFSLVVLTFAASARADPSAEDALADGEIDPEDFVVRATAGRRTLPLAPGGSAWISLVGFTRSAAAMNQEREVGGLVVVGLPFDRFARASTRSLPLPDPPRPPPPQPVPAVIATADVAEIVVTPRLARACVGAAWRSAGLGADDARLDAIVSRARWSALLPEARVRAVRFQDERLSTTETGGDPRLYDATGANLGLEARLTWRLDRLLYADDEPAFERMKLERHDARARVAARVLEALFHWQRAWLDVRLLGIGARGTRDELEASLKLAEAEAALDVLTAGWFSTQKPQRAIAPAVPRSDL